MAAGEWPLPDADLLEQSAPTCVIERGPQLPKDAAARGYRVELGQAQNLLNSFDIRYESWDRHKKLQNC